MKVNKVFHTTLVVAVAVIIMSCMIGCKSSSINTIVLENERLALRIGKDDGAIQSLHDKILNIDYELKGVAFEFLVDEDTIKGLNVINMQQSSGEITLNYETPDFTIDLFYALGATNGFVEKWIEVKKKNSKDYFVKDVILENSRLGESFKEIHFHDDNTIWHCPVNLFLRAEKGGCFAGLEYPYWKLDIEEYSGFSLGFSPNYQVASGETFVSEKYFLGLFRNEGIHRVSQGPYPGRGRFFLVDYSSGLSQHFKGGIPDLIEDVPLETLDWGEVWAMKEFMRHVLPNDLALPEDGYWVWQNGWWARLYDVKPQILDQLKEVGIHDIMTAHSWYGRGVHPLSPPYIDKARSQPLGFPQDSGVAGMPGPGDISKGLHSKHKNVFLDKFNENEFTPEFILPPAMQDFYDYGEKVGVHISSFCVPNIYFQEHPDWGAIDKDGNVSEYLFGRKVSCPANDDYMEHMFNIQDHIITKYNTRWWGFDGRWLSYWEVGHYRPGTKGTGPDPCYAENHGHLPGDNRYKEWKNIMGFIAKLKERHPKLCLETYYGLHRGGPWALRNLNSGYHYFETHGADMNRLQSWHQQNDRFRPVYKNSLDLFGNDPKGFRFNLIAGLSIANYCMVGEAYPQFAIKENREFFMKWRAWATKNLDYLTVKRDLFDSPGQLPLDGSAHIIKDRGFVFLFRGGFDKGINQETALRASIPINRWIQLEDNPDALYQIKEIYPREGKVLAIVKYGDEFLYDMPKEPAVILELEPVAGSTTPSPNIIDNKQKEVQLIHAFTAQ